jgi:formate dehydrogenase
MNSLHLLTGFFPLQRYAAGTKAILDSYWSGRNDYRPEDLIVHQGDYATKAYGQRNKK